jgi:Enoyl-(Acyl carrier protein) reductase
LSYLIDTNIISEVRKGERCDARVAAWYASIADEDLFLSTLVLGEIRKGKRGARVNCISPGIVITPLAKDELSVPRGEGYRRMIELCPVGRVATPDEVGNVGALLVGPDRAFITGSDVLVDGGVTASYWFGELAPT